MNYRIKPWNLEPTYEELKDVRTWRDELLANLFRAYLRGIEGPRPSGQGYQTDDLEPTYEELKGQSWKNLMKAIKI